MAIECSQIRVNGVNYAGYGKTPDNQSKFALRHAGQEEGRRHILLL
jgi:hypothetical protein